MSDQEISDTRRGHWWGIICPRTLHDNSWISQIASVLAALTALFIGLLIACLQIITLPLLIVVSLVFHGVKGDARVRSERLSSQ